MSERGVRVTDLPRGGREYVFDGEIILMLTENNARIKSVDMFKNISGWRNERGFWDLYIEPSGDKVSDEDMRALVHALMFVLGSTTINKAEKKHMIEFKNIGRDKFNAVLVKLNEQTGLQLVTDTGEGTASDDSSAAGLSFTYGYMENNGLLLITVVTPLSGLTEEETDQKLTGLVDEA